MSVNELDHHEVEQLFENLNFKKLLVRHNAGEVLSPIERVQLGLDIEEKLRVIEGEYRIIEPITSSEHQLPGQA